MTQTMLNLHEMEISFGPQHPSTHGVLRVMVKIDGERIVDAKPIIGYLHRGTEKLFENMNYPQCVPHTDRLDYVASATSNQGFVGAVEKLPGITDQIPLQQCAGGYTKPGRRGVSERRPALIQPLAEHDLEVLEWRRLAEPTNLSLPVPAEASAKSLGIEGWTWSGRPSTPGTP